MVDTTTLRKYKLSAVEDSFEISNSPERHKMIGVYLPEESIHGKSEPLKLSSDLFGLEYPPFAIKVKQHQTEYGIRIELIHEPNRENWWFEDH